MCDPILAGMESVINVLLLLGKGCGGQDPPSKKESAAAASRSEREGGREDRRDVLKPRKWDEIILLLAQHAMSAQWGAELRTGAWCWEYY